MISKPKKPPIVKSTGGFLVVENFLEKVRKKVLQNLCVVCYNQIINLIKGGIIKTSIKINQIKTTPQTIKINFTK